MLNINAIIIICVTGKYHNSYSLPWEKHLFHLKISITCTILVKRYIGRRGKAKHIFQLSIQCKWFKFLKCQRNILFWWLSYHFGLVMWQVSLLMFLKNMDILYELVALGQFGFLTNPLSGKLIINYQDQINIEIFRSIQLFSSKNTRY